MLIAPLSANTLAKIVNGFSDNLLVSVEQLGCMFRPVTNASVDERGPSMGCRWTHRRPEEEDPRGHRDELGHARASHHREAGQGAGGGVVVV